MTEGDSATEDQSPTYISNAWDAAGSMPTGHTCKCRNEKGQSVVYYNRARSGFLKIEVMAKDFMAAIIAADPDADLAAAATRSIQAANTLLAALELEKHT